MTLTNLPNGVQIGDVIITTSGVEVDGVAIAASNKLTVTADLSSATWNTVASHEIAVVTGLVRVQILPLCTVTGDDTSGNTGTISLGWDGTVAGMIAATEVDDLAAGEFWYDATPTTTGEAFATAVLDFVLDGKDIGYTIATEAAVAGSIKFHIWWIPLESGATVTAGEGGTFA